MQSSFKTKARKPTNPTQYILATRLDLLVAMNTALVFSSCPRYEDNHTIRRGAGASPPIFFWQTVLAPGPSSAAADLQEHEARSRQLAACPAEPTRGHCMLVYEGKTWASCVLVFCLSCTGHLKALLPLLRVGVLGDAHETGCTASSCSILITCISSHLVQDLWNRGYESLKQGVWLSSSRLISSSNAFKFECRVPCTRQSCTLTGSGWCFPPRPCWIHSAA